MLLLSNNPKTSHKILIFFCKSLEGIQKSYTFALAFQEHRHGDTLRGTKERVL